MTTILVSSIIGATVILVVGFTVDFIMTLVTNQTNKEYDKSE